jgi:hypothetical protein
MMMFRTIGIVVVCLCLIAGAGFFFKWITFTASNADTQKPDVHLTINKDKIDKDMKAAEDKLPNLFGDKTMDGTIQGIETAKEELTVRDKKDHDVMVKVDTATKINISDKAGSFADLKTDDAVSVKYEAKKDGNLAKTITVAKKP